MEKETGFADECKPFCGSFWSSFSDHKILVTKENGCELLKSKHFAIEEKEDEEEASQDDNEQWIRIKRTIKDTIKLFFNVQVNAYLIATSYNENSMVATILNANFSSKSECWDHIELISN